MTDNIQPIDALTMDDVLKALPANLRGSCSQVTIDNLNSIIQDPELRETYRNNLISYNNVLREITHVTVRDYTNAVSFVTYLNLGYNKIDAYKAVFPEKSKTCSGPKLGTYACIYSKTKLVTKIVEQSVIPLRLMNLEAPQKALNVLMDLMANARSEKVRCDAADKVLAHLAPPDEKNVNLSVNVADSSEMDQMKEQLRILAQRQRSMLDNGTITLRDLANSNILNQ